MAEKSKSIVLDSSHSTQISLEAIREGNAGLNAHRQGMLDRAPEVGDSSIFQHEVLKLIDLATLLQRLGMNLQSYEARIWTFFSMAMPVIVNFKKRW